MKYFTAILIAICLAGCYNEIDFDYPDFEQKMVINGVVKSDSTFKVRVSRSYSEAEDNLLNYPYLDDARVTLYADGEELEVLQCIEWGVYRSSTRQLPRENVNYSIQVSHPGFETVEAAASLPKKVSLNISDARKELHDVTGPYYSYNYLFTISIPDEPESNFYWLRFLSLEDQSNYADVIPPYNIYPEDNLFPDEGLLYRNTEIYQIFSDESFNGETKKIKLKIWTSDSEAIVVELHHITEELYLYLKSINNYRVNTSAVDTDPLYIYTNVKNGFGIFGGTNVSYDTLYLSNLD